MIALLALVAFAGDAPTDLLLPALEAELARSVKDLTLPDAPPLYHLRYRVLELEQVDAEASFGSLVDSSNEPLRMIFVETRVGAPEFDNTGFGGWQTGFRSAGLPLDGDAAATRTAAWRISDRAYKEAVEQYARKAAQFVAPPDYPGDYLLTGAVTDDLGSAAIGERDPIVGLARELSGRFAVDPPEGAIVELGRVDLGHEAGSVLLIDSEGTRLRYPTEETTLRATFHVRARDGMLLTDQRLWTVRRPEDLDRDAMLAEADRMAADLLALAGAETLEEEYVGPVIFEDGAAQDLFRYLLVPQLQGTPPEIPFESFFGDLGGGEQDAVRLKRRVLPLGWTVTDDPHRDEHHPAYAKYDAEGTPTAAVTLVEDGIVRDLLMSRVPRKGLEGTNGHARGGFGERAQGRPTMLEVQPPKRVSNAALVKKGLKVASSYGLDYVVVVRRLQDPEARSLEPGAYFWMDPEQPQLPLPVSFVRRYADGREVPVRGAAFAGVQRFVLRDVLAAGPDTEGSFMASPSGEPWTYGPTEGLPTWIRVPSVLVGEVELVPAPGDPKSLPVVAPPRLAAP